MPPEIRQLSTLAELNVRRFCGFFLLSIILTSHSNQLAWNQLITLPPEIGQLSNLTQLVVRRFL